MLCVAFPIDLRHKAIRAASIRLVQRIRVKDFVAGGVCPSLLLLIIWSRNEQLNATRWRIIEMMYGLITCFRTAGIYAASAPPRPPWWSWELATADQLAEAPSSETGSSLIFILIFLLLLLAPFSAQLKRVLQYRTNSSHFYFAAQKRTTLLKV